ncbi:unnamed protein product [Aureobasidium uvarum]|uniref:Required for respiratory growth protein 7, mitochondrial n=1 Tax=Aureobasidium uvarum TaxID=2773716 RepID=A0A9N8KF59_9PEZI|nr:unnamed protein product [Aureobasidium uvarum]
MHFRHALITLSRLSRRSIHSTTKCPSFSDPLSTLVNHATPAIPSTPDDTPPLKRRSRNKKADSILDHSKSSISPVDSDTASPKRRGRPRKVVDTPDDTSEETTLAPLKKRTRKPKTPNEDHLAITHGSSHHTSLSEFLSYADTANLSPTSTVYRGTHYEYTVADALEHLAFSLTRVGRASDLGIDLLGTWSIPSRSKPINVLIQCKAEAPKPSMIRELEGAVVGAPVRYRGEGTIAVLAAAKEATKGVRDAVVRSRLPMAYLNITTEGRIRQFVWNYAAVECGLEGVGVSLRYLANGESEATLTWKGMPCSKSSPKPRRVE